MTTLVPSFLDEVSTFLQVTILDGFDFQQSPIMELTALKHFKN